MPNEFVLPGIAFSGPALVLLSGGQDSCTCLAWAVANFPHVAAVLFDYGQRHRIELNYAERFAELLGVTERYRVQIPQLGDIMQSALTDSAIPVNATGGMNGLPSTFTPGRNLLFLTLAAQLAVQHIIPNLVAGFCETDYSGYPDCRREFVNAFERAFSLAIGNSSLTGESSVRVYTPLMYSTKAETFAMAAELGVLELVRDETLTCYHGHAGQRNEWGRGCGQCPACVLRKRGYEQWLETQAAAPNPA